MYFSRKQLRKLLRYIIMTFALYIIIQYIPECSITMTTSIIIATLGAVVFAMIDMYFPLCVV